MRCFECCFKFALSVPWYGLILLLVLGILDEGERAMGLNTYLQTLLSSLKGRGRFSVRLWAFLGLDEVDLGGILYSFVL